MVRRAQPVRTCVGCRKRASASELLRVVVIRSGAETFRAVPDPARGLPGRGAHLHSDPACLASAERRRAFGRAFRVSGVIDIEAVARVVSESRSAREGDHVIADSPEPPKVSVQSSPGHAR